MLFLLLSGRMPFDTSDACILRSMHKDPVLNGDNLFRDSWWHEVPAAAKSLVRGLLTADPSIRLTVEEASKHAWFRDNWQQTVEPPSELHDNIVSLGGIFSPAKSSPDKSPMQRSSRSVGLAAMGREPSRGKKGGGRHKSK